MSVHPARHWNTWDGSRPSAMVHLPTGLTLRLSTYSAKSGRFDPLLAGPAVELHEHTVDGDYVRVRAHVSDSLVEIEFAKDASGALVGAFRLLTAGEWALRFWMCLEIGYTDVRHGPPAVDERPPRVAIEPATPFAGAGPTVTAQHRSTCHALVTDSQPVFVGAYDTIDTLQGELEGKGYYAPHADVPEPSWAVLRFNGQANAEVAFAVGSGNDGAAAASHAHDALGRFPDVIATQRRCAAAGTEAWRAVRDVVAWNTIWDEPNGRPMTVLTRNWLGGKFGGWGVWLDDILFNALLAAYAGDWETARANLDAALTTVAPAGNLPCLRTAYEEWVDRSQPPIAAWVVSRIYAMSGDRTMLAAFLPVLVQSHDWWFEARDGNGDGLLEFGSSPTGTGAFVHSKQAALDEAAMDNLPMFDEAEFDPAAHTLDMAEPALNSLLVQEAEALAQMLGELGQHAEADRINSRGRRLARTMHSVLWDEERGVYAGRRWDGSFVRSLAPTSFYPWLCGDVEGDRTQQMLAVLGDETQFWGERVLPASTFDDPASADQVYWRGRIWPPLVFWVWEGLRRAGETEAADDVVERSWTMFLQGWRQRRCYENFHAIEAELDASPDSDPFYSWGALIPLMMVMGEAEAHPRRGRAFSPDVGQEVALHEPGRVWIAHRHADSTAVDVDGEPFLTVSPATDVEFVLAGHRLLMPSTGGVQTSVVLHRATVSHVLRARLGEDEAAGVDSEDGWSVELPANTPFLEVFFDCDPLGPSC